MQEIFTYPEAKIKTKSTKLSLKQTKLKKKKKLVITSEWPFPRQNLMNSANYFDVNNISHFLWDVVEQK